MKEKLTGKDLINVGIYSAIYFVIVMACAMLGVIPVMFPLLSVFVPILGGIVFMLFLTKVKKFGMIWIMSILMGILMLLTGMSYYALVVGIFSGLAAEWIYRSGKYASASKAVLTNAVFSLWLVANYLILYLDREYFLTSRAESVGQAYADSVDKLLPPWSFAVLVVVCFLCGLIGGLLGRKMLAKHFKKAGIA